MRTPCVSHAELAPAGFLCSAHCSRESERCNSAFGRLGSEVPSLRWGERATRCVGALGRLGKRASYRM
ncbi:hypothetical protein NDU88_003863 [Pleurodeles waltl]|uniref:Uncharacterized protein n=1 Tax=Pleurodeles waltl TaxID=8319 RepID=A0AAV7NHX4_PLEWA|nr:hypothetical protein NDU88_003863 [Pleurodeles waltl]